jgi:putative transposase
LWGAPRIHGELLKLGISVSESTVAKYMRRHPRLPSQTWRTFLTNHASQIMAADLFVVPTVTFRLLFVLVLLAHDRRRMVHVAVTAHPTAAWTTQQLRNAFPEKEAPRYLLHDRDSVFAHVAITLEGMNIQVVRTAPRSPWQNAYVERVIGSIRRECLDHVMVVNAAGLRRMLTAYVAYYMRSRTHLALGKDTALTRPVSPPLDGRIVATPEVGGLHHRYDRIAAWPSPRRRSQLQPGLHHPCVERFAVAVRCCGRSHSRRYRLPRTARNYARVPEAASNHLHCLRIDFSTVTGAYTIGYGSRYANREWQHHSSPM